MATCDLTLESYRHHAVEYVQKFEARPSREADVALTLRLAGVPRPRLLEVGFGSAREAGLLLQAGARYQGIDYSVEFVELARARFPQGDFREGDVRTCPLPSGLDAVFAIASLVHLPRAQLMAVLRRLSRALHPRGVFVMEIRASNRYRKEIRTDDFGSPRTFYFFNEAGVRKLAAGAGLVVEKLEKRAYGVKPWWWMVMRRAK